MTAHKPVLPLPEWVIALVAAIEKSEDEHPKYYAKFASDGYADWQELDRCPESQFLALVPEHVRQTARRWAS